MSWEGTFGHLISTCSWRRDQASYAKCVTREPVGGFGIWGSVTLLAIVTAVSRAQVISRWESGASP